MDWSTVIKSLHDESVRDAARSQNALSIERDAKSAMVYSISSILLNRLGNALEAGLVVHLNNQPKAIEGTTGYTSDGELVASVAAKKVRKVANPSYARKEFDKIGTKRKKKDQ